MSAPTDFLAADAVLCTGDVVQLGLTVEDVRVLFRSYDFPVSGDHLTRAKRE